MRRSPRRSVGTRVADAPPAIDEVIDLQGGDAHAWGILSRPPHGVPASATAVLILVGGPQYRVGSHRQFVLLARRLAGSGHPTLRFDYRGMGDRDGALRDFESAAADVQAALDALGRACPETRRIVVWGLCDAASAALMFAAAHPRVAGLAIANPWVRSPASLAAARMRHYYVERLLDRGFWTKLLRGGFAWRDSLRSLLATLRQVRPAAAPAPASRGEPAFQDRMAAGWRRLHGPLLLFLSGKDLTAREFVQHAGSAPAWRGLLDEPRLRRVDLPEADHTFSQRVWSDQLERETLAWLQHLDAAAPER